MADPVTSGINGIPIGKGKNKKEKWNKKLI